MSILSKFHKKSEVKEKRIKVIKEAENVWRLAYEEEQIEPMKAWHSEKYYVN